MLSTVSYNDDLMSMIISAEDQVLGSTTLSKHGDTVVYTLSLRLIKIILFVTAKTRICISNTCGYWLNDFCFLPRLPADHKFNN